MTTGVTGLTTLSQIAEKISRPVYLYRWQVSYNEYMNLYNLLILALRNHEKCKMTNRTQCLTHCKLSISYLA